MVFSSIPAYLDPSNWNQQQNHHIIGSSSGNPLLPPPPPPPPNQPHGGGGIRPGSMAERARMANVPMPETALKCPRCDSTNTKFCYFNNYSLSQPRHFCKTCRRYWTRGGALRNVPVGGGCRRNKRSKSSTSKSPSTSDRQTNNNPCSTSTVSTNTNAAAANMLGGLTPPPLRFMSPVGQFTDNFAGDMGLSYSGIAASRTTSEMNFHGGGATNFLGSGGMASLLSSDGGGVGGGGIEPWRVQQVQQFPFLGGLDYQFHGGESGFVGGEGEASQKRSSPVASERAAAVKMESNGDPNRLRRETILNEQWNINMNMNMNMNAHNPNNWTDLSSFSSSSATSNPPL